MFFRKIREELANLRADFENARYRYLEERLDHLRDDYKAMSRRLEEAVNDIRASRANDLDGIRERQDVIEGRIRNLDGWLQSISPLIGVGAPTGGSGETRIEGYDEDESPENFDLEDTLQGLVGDYTPMMPNPLPEDDERSEPDADQS